MKQVILDTNFIITCVKQKIDFFEEIRFMGLEIVVPKQVIAELERLSKKKGTTKVQAELALEVLRSDRPKIIDLKINYVDKAIIRYSKKNPEMIVATLDKEVKDAVSNQKLVIRGKKKLEII
jgi:uncharacterized protein